MHHFSIVASVESLGETHNICFSSDYADIRCLNITNCNRLCWRDTKQGGGSLSYTSIVAFCSRNTFNAVSSTVKHQIHFMNSFEKEFRRSRYWWRTQSKSKNLHSLGIFWHQRRFSLLSYYLLVLRRSASISHQLIQQRMSYNKSANKLW